MPHSKKIKSKPDSRLNEAIHRHLQTQFFGVKTKLIQGIDDLTGLKNELLKAVEHLKNELNHACNQYGNNFNMDLQKSIEQFCDTCNHAIETYQSAPSGYLALRKNGIDQETMDNLFNRFREEIESAIRYTGEYTPKTHELSSALHLLGSLKARFMSKQHEHNVLVGDDTPSLKK